MPLSFNLDEIKDLRESEHSGTFIATHTPIYVHHSHARKFLGRVNSGQLNTILTGKEGFGIKLEWKGDFLTIVPGVVNGDMPDGSIWLSHAAFWKREQHLRELHAEKNKSKQQQKAAEIDERSKALIRKAVEDEVI